MCGGKLISLIRTLPGQRGFDFRVAWTVIHSSHRFRFGKFLNLTKVNDMGNECHGDVLFEQFGIDAIFLGPRRIKSTVRNMLGGLR
jgi:hypothetical protein